jgi:hypothetical protein
MDKDELANFMKRTLSTLIVGERQMYFEAGEWVVSYIPKRGKWRRMIDRFLDTVPGALADALKCLEAKP